MLNENTLTGMITSKSVIDGLFYFAEKLQELERRERYDDNGAKMLLNAYRLYEKGDITEQELISVIKLLPKTKTVNVNRLDDILKRINENV